MIHHHRHVPQRTCVACGAKGDQRQFIRVAFSPEKGICVPGSRGEGGRGAYLCPRKECWEKGLKSSRIERALRVTLTNEDRAALLQYASKLQECE